MSVYNNEEFVRPAIESILGQTYQNFEFIIIDDASTDASGDIMREYVSRDNVSVLQNEANRGLTASLNRGLNYASGTYIARQDADDISRADRLETQLEYLQSHPSVGVLGTDASMIDESGRKLRRRHVPTQVSKADLLEQNRLVHGSVMARRDLLEQVGGYNELFEYVQDYELWLRLVEHTEIRNVTEPLYQFREHGERITETKLHESMLYKHLAIAVHQDGQSDLLPLVESESIHSIYHELSREARIQIHQSAAEVYLEQRNRMGVRREAQRLLELDTTRLRGYLLYLLSYTRLGTAAVVSLYYLFQRLFRRYRITQ